jgi:hypothetical protein
MKYRKKPVVIEAMQLTEENKDRVFGWIDCTRIPTWDKEGRPAIVIGTIEGDMTANIGDFIIKGVKGEFYPCKPDIFKATYDLVEEECSDPLSSGLPCSLSEDNSRVEPIKP